MKKLIYTLLMIVAFTSNSFSAGSSSDSGSTAKVSDYSKAINLVKAAKKYEKKVKPQKHKKDMQKHKSFF